MERRGGTLIREAGKRSIKERKTEGKITLKKFEKARRVILFFMYGKLRMIYKCKRNIYKCNIYMFINNLNKIMPFELTRATGYLIKKSRHEKPSFKFLVRGIQKTPKTIQATANILGCHTEVDRAKYTMKFKHRTQKILAGSD